MSNSSVAILTLPRRVDCEAAVWARRLGAAAFTVAVGALEAWLRVPVRPLLDGYLQAALLRAASIATAVSRNPSF
jgi:hypothetical protein